jgi:hypothetical protein
MFTCRKYDAQDKWSTDVSRKRPTPNKLLEFRLRSYKVNSSLKYRMLRYKSQNERKSRGRAEYKSKAE